MLINEVFMTEKKEDQGKVQTSVNNTSEIIREVSLTFEENFIAESSSDCNPYGCTCISYEKCCGCLLQ